MKESTFQNKVTNFLRSLPKTWIVKVWGGGFQRAGIPDILACVNGHFIAIELKAEQGRPSPLQIRNIEQIIAAGGTGILLYPEGFDKFKQDMLQYIQLDLEGDAI